MEFETITAIIFYAVLALVIYKYRKKFEVMHKIFILYKTQVGTNLMRNLAKFELFWKIFGTLAIPVAVYFIFIIGSLLWGNMLDIIAGTAGAGVAVAIPGLRIPGSPIFIPFWYGIISIAVLAVVHEFGHGVVAAMEGVRIKSAGFGFLAVLPLAFVELDEEQMKEMPKLARLRILSAGSFSNVCVFAVLILFLGFVFTPFMSSMLDLNGVTITSVVADQPAELSGLPVDSVVTGINGQEVMTIESFVAAMDTVQPGETIQLETTSGVYDVETASDPKDSAKPYLGVYLEQSSEPTESASEQFGAGIPVLMWFYGLIWWIANLNLLVGIMNFLPIWALDGSRIAYDLTSYVVKSERVLIPLMNIVFAFFLTLLMFNLIGPIFF